jgi:eukaryotic-like serine/threonine-protein kinase
LRSCKFSVSGVVPAREGRERACGRRTQDPVESPRTLLHAPPAWEPSSAEAGPRRRLAPARGPRAPSVSSGAERPVLGRYQLLERLGSGGFGEVWRAHDELLHREVAVKRIRLGPDGDSERATREALAAARLAHPAIVALYEAGTVDDAFFLISELVDGETLAQLIAAGTLEDEHVLEIGLALADALAHAHARGVIHRDIKPHNVLVPRRPEGAGGAAKLTDFGGASLAGEDALTRTGNVLGTLAYMAPEQSEGREVGEEADLYSLALVLYEALCGVNPVRGPTPAATARRIGKRIDPLERRRRDLPRALTRALDTALSPSPRDRSTLEQLRLALEEALEQRRGRHGREPAEPRATARYARRQPLARGTLARHRPATAAAIDAELQPRSAPSPEALAAEVPTPAWRGLPLPPAVWSGLAIATILWLLWTGRAGLALLLVAALAPLLALPDRRGGYEQRAPAPVWPVCLLAPVLGLAGLAGAFPAIAGQARRWRERAALGALAYWWLLLAEPLLEERLWLGAPSGLPARAVWEGSLGATATHVVGPMLSLGMLLAATLWAAAALVLPWLVRGRSAALDVVAATTGTAAVAAATPLFAAGLTSHAAHPSPRGAVLGAVLGATLAVAARALRGPV